MSTTRRGALAAMGAAVIAPLGLVVRPRVQALAVRPRRSKPYIDYCPEPDEIGVRWTTSFVEYAWPEEEFLDKYPERRP